MKVIFFEDDRIEDVSEGYARNFLFPRKVAIIATPGAVAAAEKRSEKKKAEIEKKKDEMRALAEKIGSCEIVIELGAGEGGKLFGSVTSQDIASAVKKVAGVEIDKRKVVIEEPIKVIGDYAVLVKLYQGVNANLKIKVAAK